MRAQMSGISGHVASKTRLVKTDIWMMEKGLTCLAEIIAVLSFARTEISSSRKYYRLEEFHICTLSDIHNDLKLVIVSTRKGNQ